MPGSPILNTQPPVTGKVPVHPLKALSEGFEMFLTRFGIPRPLVRIGQGYGEDPTLVSPEGGAVDASHTTQEIPATGPGESPDLSPDTSISPASINFF